MTTTAPDLSAFYTDPDALPPVYLDRTPLQRYAACPFQGWAVEAGFVDDVSFAADSGTEVHDVLAGGIHDYAQAGERPLEYWRGQAEMSRPDVQPHVVEAVQRGAWTFWQFLRSQNPLNLMRYQGGPGAVKDAEGNETEPSHSGQIAWELLPATEKRGPIMVTTELDLLLAGETETELLEVDTKSGNKVWTSTDIAESFQFRTHAWLIFANYPKIEQVHVRIFMPRLYGADAQWSPTVTFTRRDVQAHTGRLLMAVEYRRQMFEIADDVRQHELLSDCADGTAGWDALIGAIDAAAKSRSFKYAWPLKEKCVWCSVGKAKMCPRVLLPASQIHDDPVAYAQDTELMRQVWKERMDTLCLYVAEHGDIEDKAIRFAWGLKPKEIRKPRPTDYGFYTPEGTDEEVPA